MEKGLKVLVHASEQPGRIRSRRACLAAFAALGCCCVRSVGRWLIGSCCAVFEDEGLQINHVARRRRPRTVARQQLRRALQRLTVLREPVINVAGQRQRVEQSGALGVGEPANKRTSCAQRRAHPVGHRQVAQQRLTRRGMRCGQHEQLALLLVHGGDDQQDRTV